MTTIVLVYYASIPKKVLSLYQLTIEPNELLLK
jgi:hypothetical protein